MTRSAWIKPSVIVGIIGIVVAVIGIMLSNPSIISGPESAPGPEPPTKDEAKIIANEIKEMLHDKVIDDVRIIRDNLNSGEIQAPFDPVVIENDEFLSCNNEPVRDIKCSVLEDIVDKTDSEYAFLFYYPGKEIANTTKKTSLDCIIEISTLNSVDVLNITNNWNDRQWCNSQESVLMTDQYNPRNKSTINVNSLLLEYHDSNTDQLGIVNAYNLEKFIATLVNKNTLSSFNVILFDDKNCVAAAVSKTKDVVIHMDGSIWELSNVQDNIFQISEDLDNDTNCRNELAGYNLDAHEYVEITSNENSNSETSKLNGKYLVVEMDPVTHQELGITKPTDIFQDWHLLVLSD